MKRNENAHLYAYAPACHESVSISNFQKQTKKMPNTKVSFIAMLRHSVHGIVLVFRRGIEIKKKSLSIGVISPFVCVYSWKLAELSVVPNCATQLDPLTRIPESRVCLSNTKKWHTNGPSRGFSDTFSNSETRTCIVRL